MKALSLLTFTQAIIQEVDEGPEDLLLNSKMTMSMTEAPPIPTPRMRVTRGSMPSGGTGEVGVVVLVGGEVVVVVVVGVVPVVVVGGITTTRIDADCVLPYMSLT